MIRGKHPELWLPGYALQQTLRLTRGWRPQREPRHLLVAVCDHFEPRWRTRDPEQAMARAERWRQGYPALASTFCDADGRPPRHTFFVPVEEIETAHLTSLEPLCRSGLAEVELHLHHDGDDAASLRRSLQGYVAMLAERGHLSRTSGGVPRYAFVHGNWALANARPDGKWCGVKDELRVLFETGCYADFTFPAFPDPSQPRVVNRIYWPRLEGRPTRTADAGTEAHVGGYRDDRVLIVEGPLAIARRPGAFRIRVDNGALMAHDPATPDRLRSWIRAGVHVAGRPEWQFVKLHTHGAPEDQANSLLGAGGRSLHESLAELVRTDRWRLHYVTARELFNIAIAAMAGATGDPGRYRDYLLPPPPIARIRARKADPLETRRDSVRVDARS